MHCSESSVHGIKVLTLILAVDNTGNAVCVWSIAVRISKYLSSWLPLVLYLLETY